MHPRYFTYKEYISLSSDLADDKVKSYGTSGSASICFKIFSATHLQSLYELKPLSVASEPLTGLKNLYE
ncbi:MAG: hypothetical protein ACTSVU_07220 [Promethearchaeota archaeon]